MLAQRPANFLLMHMRVFGAPGKSVVEFSYYVEPPDASTGERTTIFGIFQNASAAPARLGRLTN